MAQRHENILSLRRFLKLSSSRAFIMVRSLWCVFASFREECPPTSISIAGASERYWVSVSWISTVMPVSFLTLTFSLPVPTLESFQVKEPVDASCSLRNTDRLQAFKNGVYLGWMLLPFIDV